MNSIVTLDPASHRDTTYMPIWYIIQVLEVVGINNTWDGTRWAILGHIPISQTPSQTGSSSTPPPPAFSLPNQAAADTAIWSRASRNLYLLASTDASFSATATQPLLTAKPGQSLYLMVYDNAQDIRNEPVWSVNSPTATITNDTSSNWTLGSHSVMTAVLIATKPGVYTIQANVNGRYCVPLVLIVGMNQLSGPAVSVPEASSGVAAIPAALPTVAPLQGGTVTVWPYQPVGGWLPVAGHVSGTASTVTVDLTNDDGSKEWNYVLPVQNGQFQGMTRVPIQGAVRVALIPDMWSELNHTSGSWTADVSYNIRVDAAPPTELQKALLSSAMMDWNLSPDFLQTAAMLVDNSPSKRTAIAAISNYVSEKVIYDYLDYNANRFIWKNSTVTWQTSLGVCEDMAELTASMLKSLGIPAETLTGTAPPTAQPDDHEWLRAFDGSTWMVTDPTWNSMGQNINAALSNEYMTSTDSLTTSHVLDSSQSYTWQ